MDVKDWLAENAKTRRNKFAFLIGLVIFPCVLLYGLYQLYLNINNLETTLHHNVVLLSSKETQSVNAHHAQTAFNRQVMGWQAVFMRGNDNQTVQSNWDKFLGDEGDVRDAIAAARGDNKNSVLMRVKSGGQSRFVAVPLAKG